LLNKNTPDPKEFQTRFTHAYGSWRGTYTSHVSTKKLNRDAENILITAETFASIGSGLQGKPFHPRIDFREAWKTLLRNQFHDVLAGTIVGDAARDADEDLRGVVKEGKRLLNFGLEAIGSRINTSKTENPLIIYNPLSWNRTGIIRANLRFIRPIGKFSITDAAGNLIPFQVDSVKENQHNVDISMLAGDIPAVGFKVFSVHSDTAGMSVKGMAVSANSAENKYFTITWDNEGLTSIFDKTLSKEVLSGKGNTLQLLEEEPSSSWGLFFTGKKIPITSLKGAEMIENGPVRLVIQWRDVTEESLFVRKMILEKESSEVKFSILTDWHDHDKLLKVAFPVKVDQGRASYEIPYGNIERSLSDLDNPAQNWVDLSNGTWGVSLLNNGRYGFSINEGMIQMSVIRGPRDMNPRMDHGIQEVNYVLVAHKGGWREAEIVNKAYEFNRPLIALQESKHVSEVSGWTRNISLPLQHSFYGTDQKNVIISAIKVLQGDWSPASIVIRVFETYGKECQVSVKLPFKPSTIVEANHIEIPLALQPKIELRDGGFSFKIGKDQIRTFILNGFSE
jgi:alpha-mannosidase